MRELLLLELIVQPLSLPAGNDNVDVDFVVFVVFAQILLLLILLL